jgi:hypothetical protein
MRQYTVVRAGIDHRRSNNDCNYKAAHDFLRQFGKCFAGMIAKQRLRTTRTDRRSRYVYFQVLTVRRGRAHCCRHCPAAGPVGRRTTGR